MIRRLKKLLRREDANMAVEFALILPVMLGMQVGTVDLVNMLMIDRKVAAAAQTVADLIAQDTAVNDTELGGIWTASKLVLSPFDSTHFGVGIASVRYDGDGDAYLDWSKSYNGLAVASPESLAEDMGGANESVVIVRARYSFSPYFAQVFTGTKQVEEIIYARPRTVRYVEKK